jgi:hypothetical protein
MLSAGIDDIHARESAAVRIGDHDSYVRVVLETPASVRPTVEFDPDGMTARVIVARGFDISVPGRMAGTIATIEKLSATDASSGFIVRFRVPVRLSGQLIIPADASNGQRFVLDFQTAVATETVPALRPSPPSSISQAPPAPPPSSSPPNKAATFILAGFRSAIFGATRKDALDAIEKDFGAAVRDRAEEGDHGSQHIVKIFPPSLLANTPPPTVAYYFDTPARGLSRITIIWDGPDGQGVAENDVAQITSPTVEAFKTIDFSPGKSLLNITMPHDLVVVFEGVDADGNTTRMTTSPAKSARENNAKRFIVELTYEAAPPSRAR